MCIWYKMAARRAAPKPNTLILGDTWILQYSEKLKSQFGSLFNLPPETCHKAGSPKSVTTQHCIVQLL